MVACELFLIRLSGNQRLLLADGVQAEAEAWCAFLAIPAILREAARLCIAPLEAAFEMARDATFNAL